jgi:hypothetical protein
LDHRNLTKAQKVLFELDAHAYGFLMDALSLEIYYWVDGKATACELWEAINRLYGDSTSDDDIVKEDDPKEEVHESVEHDHDLGIVEDCSISWSSDDNDDRSTTSSLDKVEDDASSVANDDATPCTPDSGDDGSCPHDIATTSSPTTSHCFMSQGDTKVSNANMIDLDSYEELLDRFGSKIKALEKEMAKTKKLRNENSFLKNM